MPRQTKQAVKAGTDVVSSIGQPDAVADPAASTTSTTSADSKIDDKTRDSRVREAAYRRFEARGGAHGEHDRDWFDAEAEIDRDTG